MRIAVPCTLISPLSNSRRPASAAPAAPPDAPGRADFAIVDDRASLKGGACRPRQFHLGLERCDLPGKNQASAAQARSPFDRPRHLGCRQNTVTGFREAPLHLFNICVAGGQASNNQPIVAQFGCATIKVAKGGKTGKRCLLPMDPVRGPGS